MAANAYPIGTAGKPWGEAEKAQWRERQQRRRSYRDEVLSRVDALRERFDVSQYGTLDYGPDSYPLNVLRSRNWQENRPLALVTGGVHGYETSGVHGALAFAEERAAQFTDHVNLMLVPCVSPWGYERIHRWNPNALDPNRSFHADSAAQESALLMQLVAPMRGRFALHIDLHETTDSDEAEFRPALAARDGLEFQPGEIPDGFYLVADSENPQLAFQKSVIAAVEKVTHIAPADNDGKIIGSPAVSRGVIEYPFSALGLCAGITGARCTTTTEVYPDSPRATPEICNGAQMAAVSAAIEFVLHSTD